MNILIKKEETQMKKYILVFGIGVSFILASCSSSSNASYGRLTALGSDSVYGGADITIFQDKETGCQYFFTVGYSDSITPVLDKEGKPYCK
jgi:hypothetical protein